jgi:hypothetical protein
VALAFHGRFLALVEQLERNFPISQWKCGDVEVWPLARMDLYLDMYWSQAAYAAPVPRPLPLRALARLATPVNDLWRSRHDLKNWTVLPRPAHAIFLGDGVSLDFIDNAWQDRFCEPLIVELERSGLRTFLMQGGELARLPWHRPTFSANMLGAWGALAANAVAPRAELPELDEVMRTLAEQGVEAPSLTFSKLERRARVVHATASAFEWVLRAVKPTLAFVVTFYAGLGAAFLVACRRQRVLSIDLQHCPQEGAHKAYGWSQVPPSGYATLPAIFWTWTAHDADYIRRWAGRLERPWHRSVHGGHTQLAGFLGESGGNDDKWEKGFASKGLGVNFEREILVALQPIGAQRVLWKKLREQIERAPRGWRWWIRRHPASTPVQDREHVELLSLETPNVVVEAASSLPLPALLRRMHAVVSLASGASAEAAAFGVPAYFLSEEARVPFEALIRRGQAIIVDVEHLNAELEQLPLGTSRPAPWRAIPLADTLRHLTEVAHGYAQW